MAECVVDAQLLARRIESKLRIKDDLELAYEAATLRETYGGHWKEHPEYPISQWMAEVEGFDTRLGYWEWIANVQRGKEVEPVT